MPPAMQPPRRRLYAAAKSVAAVAVLSSLLLPWSSCTTPGGQEYTVEHGFTDAFSVALLLWPLAFAAVQWLRPATRFVLATEILLCLFSFVTMYLGLAVEALISLFAEVKPGPGQILMEAGLTLYLVTAVAQASQRTFFWMLGRRRLARPV